MIAIRSPIPTHLASKPTTPSTLRSPILLSTSSNIPSNPNTPRNKRHLSSVKSDVHPLVSPVNRLDKYFSQDQRPSKRFRLNHTPHSSTSSDIKLIDNGTSGEGIDNCEKGKIVIFAPLIIAPCHSSRPINKAKMDVQMISQIDMEEEEREEQYDVQPKLYPTFSTSRPKLGRLDTTASLDFEPGSSTISNSSYSIGGMSNQASPTKPASLPPVMHLKRNPKKLSLSLPASSSTSYSSSPDCSTPSTICPTPTAESDSKFGTPYTPGPPKTPALAMSLGRSTFKGNRRPSMLSLITNPPGNDDEVPPTPGAIHPYATKMTKTKGVRARSQTELEFMGGSILDQQGRSSSLGFQPIDENPTRSSGGLSALGFALPSTSSLSGGVMVQAYNSSSPTTSNSTISDEAASSSSSSSSTPSTSPPIPTAFTFQMPLQDYYTSKRQKEPYEDGPIEFLPGVYLGSEDSVHQFDKYAGHSKRVRIVNVAQEIDDPFDPSTSSHMRGWTTAKGKEKMKLTTYPDPNGRPEIEYCHIRWSHGELGLADLPPQAILSDLLDFPTQKSLGGEEDGMWGFWDSIKWMEGGRKEGIPILIHCQCGVSRSATLAIAYTMALAAIGAMSNTLRGIRSMQDAYDFVKAKSSWVGPNHSLVFQLVDFARHLTNLLSLHLSTTNDKIITSFPTNSDAELSEAEWAKRRKEFEESEEICCISPEEADEEARRLDEEMLLRKARR
ncbi:uncharacterized protein I206_101431 [Kwoniella pini CBS 10737]|uniref:protein-tyrosine-phosphatase n=1 Tax=Kwoniella pini CBS 10737 TaxID=1296096 RepID=A0A1B9HWP2_9TREE|nr:uncharacterized protein I206_06598 [Kwoniella pini CBS 10737]OCF47692.1 hypothetical protein I206_06598 [Kwoniella pini CBS 10737]